MTNKLPVVGKRYTHKKWLQNFKCTKLELREVQGVSEFVFAMKREFADFPKEYSIIEFSNFEELPEDANRNYVQDCTFHNSQILSYLPKNSTETKSEPLSVKSDTTVEEKCRICGVINTYDRHVLRIKDICENCFKDLPNILAKAEIKPQTQSLELSPEVKEAMDNLKYHAGITNYFDKEIALDDIKDAAKKLLNALDKQFKVNETSESVDSIADVEDVMEKIKINIRKEMHLPPEQLFGDQKTPELREKKSCFSGGESIWKPVSELPKTCDSAFIKFTTASGIMPGYFYAGGDTFYQNSNCRDEDEINKEYIKEFCLLSDLINDYEKLKERVKKLEGAK